MNKMIINIPIGILIDAANVLDKYTSENIDLFNQVLNLINSVESCGDWQGQSMKALKSITQTNAKKFKDGMGDLNALSEFLNNYVKKMTEEDQSISRQIQRI